jgi:hypothetical protein
MVDKTDAYKETEEHKKMMERWLNDYQKAMINRLRERQLL